MIAITKPLCSSSSAGSSPLSSAASLMNLRTIFSRIVPSTEKAVFPPQSIAATLSRVASPEVQITAPLSIAITSGTVSASTMGWVNLDSQTSRLSTRSLCSSMASQNLSHTSCCRRSPPRGTAIPSESAGPRRSLLAWRKLVMVGRIVSQNCWFPRSSWTSLSGTFLLPWSNSTKCKRWLAFSNLAGGSCRVPLLVS